MTRAKQSHRSSTIDGIPSVAYAPSERLRRNNAVALVKGTRPTMVWTPSKEILEASYATALMKRLGATTVQELRAKSVANIEEFWTVVLEDLGVEWFEPYRQLVDRNQGIEWTRWFVDGKINVTHNCVDRHAKGSRANHAAIVWEGDDGNIRKVTYREFDEQVCQTANALKQLGITKDDCVGILMPMVPEVTIQLFACLKIGAVAIPIFSGFGSEAIASRLSEAKAKVLFTSDVSLRRGKTINVKVTADGATRGLSIRQIVFRRGDGKCPWDSKRDFWWHEFVLGQPKTCKTEALDSEARSLILFTSGTTGKPKGAIHTHAGSLVQIAKEHRYAFNVDDKTRFFWFTDIGWMMGPWEMIGVTFFGGTVFLYEGAPDYPTPYRLWEMIDRHDLHVLGISPTAIRLLMRSPVDGITKSSLSSLKLLGSTGEPWDPESYQWFFKNVGRKRCPIINISGGTELIGCLLSPLPIEPLKVCSLGGPGLGVDADVFDESGHSVRGGIGHLVCKQPIPSMTKGFLNSKERYLETYFSKWKGVWYHGDWAKVDEDGQWFLGGRSDDTIKIAGKRVGPMEYEAALLHDSRVSEAATVGVPDELKGETAICYVVLKPKETASEILRGELKGLLASTLGKSLLPKEIRFTQALPKTRSAKILRGLIRKIYLGEPIADTSSVENTDALEEIRRAT